MTERTIRVTVELEFDVTIERMRAEPDVDWPVSFQVTACEGPVGFDGCQDEAIAWIIYQAHAEAMERIDEIEDW